MTLRWSKRLVTTLFTLTILFAPLAFADDEHGSHSDEKKKTVAGKADFLRSVPKKFATLVDVNPQKHEVTLRFEGEEEAKTWAVNADAEIKIHGWWGRLEQFSPRELGARVWVWLDIDRKSNPKSVLMLADEISEQDIHGVAHTLTAADAEAQTLTVKNAAGENRELTLPDELSFQLSENTISFAGRNRPVSLQENFKLKMGETVYVQSAGDSLRLAVNPQQLETIRESQIAHLRESWRKGGLPATVTFLHPLGGEMELMLDHESMRWGRYLKNGDNVTIQIENPVKAQVKFVRPWRERTQVRLVTASGRDQLDMETGQRVGLLVPEPPLEVQQSSLPPDIGRERTKDERIEWFLCSVYCPCKIAGDRCTGMFFTQASCNENACHMPKHLRGQIGKLIDEGLGDEELLEQLAEKHGPQLLRQHLLR